MQHCQWRLAGVSWRQKKKMTSSEEEGDFNITCSFYYSFPREGRLDNWRVGES